MTAQHVRLAKTTDLDLTALVELADALRRSAAMPDLLLHIDCGMGNHAEAVGGPCTHAPQIRLGGDLLGQSLRLQGALAHEIAHHALGHISSPGRWYRAAKASGAAFLLALAAGLPWWVVAALAVVGVAAYLMDARGDRSQEYAADIYSAELLDLAGLDGRLIVTETLAVIPDETRWYCLAGWIVGTHPTPGARRRHATRVLT